MQDNSKVNIGVTTYVGWAVALAGAVPIVVKTISESESTFRIGGPEKWLALLSLVALTVTHIGRYAQSAIQVKATPGGAAEGVLPETSPEAGPEAEPDAEAMAALTQIAEPEAPPEVEGGPPGGVVTEPKKVAPSETSIDVKKAGKAK